MSGGYEKTDAPAKPLVVFAIFLLTFMFVVFFVVVGLFRVFDTICEMMDPEELYSQPQSQTPASGPLLQQREAREYLDYRARSQWKLGHYGWVSEEAGIARVPISEAIHETAKNNGSLGE